MNKESLVRKYLNKEKNRTNMINKINNGLKNKDIQHTKDPEVEQFQKGFLENWENLENFPEAAEDLIGLSDSQKEDKKEQLKVQFCAWVSGEDAISEGYAFAYEKKEHMQEQLSRPGKNIAKKLKDGVDFITGTKVGRNEPCPCGSGNKYKKCCGGYK